MITKYYFLGIAHFKQNNNNVTTSRTFIFADLLFKFGHSYRSAEVDRRLGNPILDMMNLLVGSNVTKVPPESASGILFVCEFFMSTFAEFEFLGWIYPVVA